MTDTLTALDATFLELEQQDEGALMHIGGVMVFDPPPDRRVPTIEELSADLAARMQRFPRYAQRLSSPRTGGLAWPRWVDDDRYRVRDHVSHVALPAPGGEQELCEWAADFYSHRLDRTRPLWEIALIEGLADGGWAMAHKTHHCLVDGVGSVDVGNVLLDREPAPELPPLVPASPAGAGLSASGGSDSGSLVKSLVPAASPPIAQAARTSARTVQAGLHAALHPRDALGRSRSLAELLIRDELIGAPHTSLGVAIGSTRRFAVLTRPLAELRAIRRHLGGSVNDVALAACANGLRRLLLGRGEELPRRGLRAMVPVNLRDGAEHLALGNRVSSLFVELPVAVADARERHRQIVATTRRLKASSAADGAAAVIDVAALAPPVLHAALARSLYATRLFNVTITNVPGSPAPLYAFGAQLREVYPVVPLAAGHAVGVAIFSYNGLITFGVIADSESTPDIDVLTDGIAAGIDDLLALVPPATQSPTIEQARI